MRIIDADALGAHMFHGYGTEITPVDIGAEIYKLGWNDAIEAIMDNAPTVEPEQKKGKWIIDKDCEGKTRTVTCNLCGYKEFNWYDPNFCPNCGSEMEGES